MASTKQLAPVLTVLVSLHLLVCCVAAVSKVVNEPAVMSVNGFGEGEEGGPSECDGHYHSDSEMLAALPTGWYDQGRRCFRTIRIASTQTGRSVDAKVVDECDFLNGCKPNQINTSAAVWKALGLDTNAGEVPITWTDV